MNANEAIKVEEKKILNLECFWYIRVAWLAIARNTLHFFHGTAVILFRMLFPSEIRNRMCVNWVENSNSVEQNSSPCTSYSSVFFFSLYFLFTIISCWPFISSLNFFFLLVFFTLHQHLSNTTMNTKTPAKFIWSRKNETEHVQMRCITIVNFN